MWTRRYLNWILGELLHLANSAPPLLWKNEFYAIKDQILFTHGHWEANHLQHILKECYTCEGSGKRQVQLMVLGELTTLHSGNCPRCQGTGKYQEFWTVLRSYRLGNRRFHSPIFGKQYKREDMPALQFTEQIEGYIRHEHPKYYLNAEAAYWMALIYDRATFFRWFGHCGHPSRKFTPMVILGTWLFNISQLRHIRYRIADKVSWWRRRYRASIQKRCRHEFPWSEEPSVWDTCKKCGVERLYTPGYDGVPF